MTKIAAKVADRISSGLKRFQPILESARARDINESDTVVIVTDMLQYILGYDKYAEITSEHAIRGTYCDLAIKLDGKLSLLIEVKAIGLGLKDNYVKQAVDYAANQGCDWVVLTNGILWHAFRITFEKPIQHELVLDIDLSKLNPKKGNEIELLWLISREGVQKAGLELYRSQRAALSRFMLAALLQTDPVLDVLRRELRRISPDAKIECEDICAVLTNEVLKREALEGEKAQAATRAVARAANRTLRKAANNPDTSVESVAGSQSPEATERSA